MGKMKLNMVRGLGLHYTRSRRVATWSPLAFAFNAKSSRTRSLRSQVLGERTGLFGYNELQDPSGFYFMKDNAVSHTEVLIHEAQSPKRERKMVQIFDELSDTLCKVADLSEFIRVAHPNERFAYAAKEASISVSNVVENLNTNSALYAHLKKVVDNGDTMATTPTDDHVAQLFLLDFEQCGIHLDKAGREKVVEYNDYILHVGSNFMNQSLNPKTVLKSELPEAVQSSFDSDDGKVVISGLFADSNSEAIREAAYKLYLSPNEQQEKLLDELLLARHKLATLCGFKSYAHRAVKEGLAESPEFVNEFLDILSNRIKRYASDDYVKLAEAKNKNAKIHQKLMPWDVPYYTAKVRQEMYDIRLSDYCPYFSLGACMDGLNYVFQELYGVVLEVEEVKEGELWHEDVKKLAVKEQGEVLGYIYCDFYERPGKPNQDCHFTIQGGKMMNNGIYQKPIVVLMLNLPTPTWSAPSLLTHSMVDNLFHEMGHATHSMFARTTYQHVTGTRCPTDLAEVPSVLMEYFSSDPRVVSKFARHYKTGETIPPELAKRLFLSRRLFLASETQLQVFYAAFDQACHSEHPLGCSTTELLSRVQDLYYGLPHAPQTAWHLRFGHLVGYGAKYYSYLMSRAIASWIWHAYFKSNPFNGVEGRRYRTEVLAHGGSKPAQLLVKDYLGQEITSKLLSEALLKDVSSVL